MKHTKIFFFWILIIKTLLKIQELFIFLESERFFSKFRIYHYIGYYTTYVVYYTTYVVYYTTYAVSSGFPILFKDIFLIYALFY